MKRTERTDKNVFVCVCSAKNVFTNIQVFSLKVNATWDMRWSSAASTYWVNKIQIQEEELNT